MNNYISFSNVLKFAAVILLLYATSRHQYGYYIFLRWYIFIAFIYLSYSANKEKIKVWFVIFSIIALLFNPIIPVYLNKEIWSVIDILCAITIFISIFYLPPNRDR